MTRGPFDPAFDDLPRVIPIFPLTGVLLLPGGKLPLNIFEPRYLAMTRSALATGQRLIGMVQPTVPTPEDNRGPTPALLHGDRPDIYRTGCAGRISGFAETEDGRYRLTLTGVIRFDATEEVPSTEGFRRVAADYSRFRADLDDARPGAIDRERILGTLRAYLEHGAISANWEAIEATPDEHLITSLAMSCPFSAPERQALLEATDLGERARVMITLLEMAAAQTGGEESASDH